MATGLAPLRFAKDLIRRSEGRARADHHRARPFPITLDELGAVEASACSAGTAARTRTAGRVGYLGDHVAFGASATET
jgi:hypothetical protein